MRQFATALLILFTVFGANSQTYEIGAMLGGSNYIGDIGKTNYINPNSLALGGILKWNRSPRHAFRASLLYTKIKGDDSKSGNSRREQRGYSFENSIKELSIGLEFNFWEFNVHNQKVVSTPYLYTGFTTFLYNDSGTLDRGNGIVNKEKNQNEIDFAIPMVIGYKTRFSRNAMVGFEIGARYTFTDNLDGSNPAEKGNQLPDAQFGNINNDDWYVFTGITVTFAFGRLPCYCNF